MPERLRLTIRGAVQGVGFRPFVYRLAKRFALAGWVNNGVHGVTIEFEGPRESLEAALLAIEPERPPRSVIQSLESVWLDAVGYERFEIRDSDDTGPATAFVLPDIATCPDCRAEIFDRANRRYRYPFTNCTNCGPRYSLIESLPYDRAATSMRRFTMCDACEREYRDPANRRFHAQPNACPVCGPQLALWSGSGRLLAARDAALTATVAALRGGLVVAVKGLGGFHLMARAADERAVGLLRTRKRRMEKPFAVMAASVADVEALCRVSPAEARLLQSAEAPIVLLRKGGSGRLSVADAVAPGNPRLGVMLPYTPLHHLLLADLGEPVVATSGNATDEPIAIDEVDALDRLGGLADLFLVHDRPIVRHVDDSIARVQLDRELLVRRARGYAPLPVTLPVALPPIIAVGGHLKNTVAVSVGRNAFVSQHIGDLETPQALDAFGRVIAGFDRLFGVHPQAVVCDLHPDYASSLRARAMGVPVNAVQHHFAHVAAAAAENGVVSPYLGVSWDGTGFGLDGTVWGGEFLLVGASAWERVACLRPFRLPGRDQAVREPRRAAMGVLHELFGDAALDDDRPCTRGLSPTERGLIARALARGLNAPVTSSAGRLFDAVASLTDLKQVMTYEGQAAMALESAVDESATGAYRFDLKSGAAWRRGGPCAKAPFDPPVTIVDWAPTILAVLDDLAHGTSVPVIAARWHRTMAEVIVAVARTAGHLRVVLSGGCFQNAVLCEWTDSALRQAGFAPYWHQRVPPNDGGISLGQLAALASAAREAEVVTCA